MNKREKAEMELLQQQLRLAKALRFTEQVQTDVPIPTTWDALTKGFLYVATMLGSRVEPACSSAGLHAFGRDDKVDSQSPRSLYSTRLLALRALRNDAEGQCARWLAEIDQKIEQEMERR